MKVVVNRCYGGFGLSDTACEWLMKNKGYTLGDGNVKEDWNNFDIVTHSSMGKYAILRTHDGVSKWDREFRTHPDVIAVIEALGKGANGMCASLDVVEIPDGIEWDIDDHDGIETIHEEHRCW